MIAMTALIAAAAVITTGQDGPDPQDASSAGPAAGSIEAMGPVSGISFETAWRPGPSLAHARAGLAATVVDGKLYAAGGAGLVDPRDDFDLFDPDFGIWSPLPALPEGLERFAMAEAAGRVFVAGGYSGDSGTEPVATVWSYDPDANVWQSEPDMPGAKASFAMLSHEGKLYAVGGEDGTAGMFVYDPETLEWGALPAPETVNRRGLAAVQVGDTFWLIGGAREGAASASVDIYDPVLGEWRAGPELPEPRAGHAAAAIDGTIHVFGGRSADMRRTVREHLVLEPGTDRWDLRPPLVTARTEAAAAALNGEVWLIGGGAGAGFFAPFTAIDSVDVFNPDP